MPGFQRFINGLLLLLGFVFFTALTQVGGVILLFTYHITGLRASKFPGSKLLVFILAYSIFSYLIIPLVAPIFGRERIEDTSYIKPATYFTVLCNRNYLIPEAHKALKRAANELSEQNSAIKIHYLDANFPFFSGFPLLPHLSHDDGKKLDISFVYENNIGEISNLQKSKSGYGIFVEPSQEEINQTKICKDAGYWQYDYAKYLTFGETNKPLHFSEKGTKMLINTLLKDEKWDKLFIEPHLKKRLNLEDERIRFHGCGAVRHDDHIHIQLK